MSEAIADDARASGDADAPIAAAPHDHGHHGGALKLAVGAMGVVFGVLITYALRDEGLEVIRVPVLQLAVFFVLALVIGVLAAVLPARRAARLDVLQAIATE